jgi:hypothetical protein
MEPQTLLLLVAVLACPIGMGLMMYMMNRNMGGQQGQSMPGHTAHTSEADHLQALREQRRLLEQEIAEAEKIVALEEKKKALAPGHALDGQAQPAEKETLAAQTEALLK